MIKYTKEQKLNALEMLAALGPHKTQRETGIPATTLYRWKKKIQGESDAQSDSPAPVDEDPVAVDDMDEMMTDAVSPEEDPNESCVDEKLLHSLLAANEMQNIENTRLRRENEQLRRTLLVLLGGDYVGNHKGPL